MNVYDFDKTIYKNDCTLEFFKFCLKKKPSISICILHQVFAAGLYLINVYSKTKFKEHFFCFLKYFDNLDSYIEIFWENEIKNIRGWYLERKKENDVIISASPEFLVKKAANLIGIRNVIASQVDKKTGKFLSDNCYGKEKLNRFNEKYENCKIDQFYSDSISDEALANVAEKAFLVYGEKFYSWNQKPKQKHEGQNFIDLCRYGFWASITTIINILLFYLLVKLDIKYIVSNIVSYLIAVAISYYFNRRFVFKVENITNTDEIHQIIKYIFVRILSISIDSGLLWIFVDIMKLNILLSKIAVSALVILFTYLLNRCLVFHVQN